MLPQSDREEVCFRSFGQCLRQSSDSVETCPSRSYGAVPEALKARFGKDQLIGTEILLSWEKGPYVSPTASVYLHMVGVQCVWGSFVHQLPYWAWGKSLLLSCLVSSSVLQRFQWSEFIMSFFKPLYDTIFNFSLQLTYNLIAVSGIQHSG